MERMWREKLTKKDAKVKEHRNGQLMFGRFNGLKSGAYRSSMLENKKTRKCNGDNSKDQKEFIVDMDRRAEEASKKLDAYFEKTHAMPQTDNAGYIPLSAIPGLVVDSMAGAFNYHSYLSHHGGLKIGQLKGSRVAAAAG